MSVVLSMNEIADRYLKPAAEDLARRVKAGEPLTPFEAQLVRSMGKESASWYLNVPDERR